MELYEGDREQSFTRPFSGAQVFLWSDSINNPRYTLGKKDLVCAKNARLLCFSDYSDPQSLNMVKKIWTKLPRQYKNSLTDVHKNFL